MTGAGEADAGTLTRELVAEVLWRGAGVRPGSLAAVLLSPLIRRPLRPFCEIVAGFDERVAADGFRPALDWLLPHFVDRVTTAGEHALPLTGPLLIAANHPGTCDAIAIAASVARDDLRILAARIPFLDRLPATRANLLFTSPDPHERMSAIWSAIRHLRAGGAVLMFPSGGLDPDPSFMHGLEAGLATWSGSVETILRRASGARFVPAIVSGVLLPRYMRHVFTRRIRARRDRQRVAEYLQVIRQTARRSRLKVSPHITFGEALTLDQLGTSDAAPSAAAAITSHARVVLASHLQTRPPRSG
jgi:hypothetical protein